MDIATGLVECACPECWKEGCGLNGCFGVVADVLEAVAPVIEYCADCLWCLGSPLAFPLIFLFDPGPETDPPNGGWDRSMLGAPCYRPMTCCFATLCAPCGQWVLRRQALNGDMSRYKLWQGQHDGPQCCARYWNGAPIVVRSGTYGEENCPNTFLCLEVWCLGGIWSTCCSFNVTRRLMKEERDLGSDPTEIRYQKCIGFFSSMSHRLCQLACCVGISGCLVGCCAPASEGAQECSGAAGRASRACCSIVRTCWRGIWSTKMIAMGCMSAQMVHQVQHDKALLKKKAPESMKMVREDEDDVKEVDEKGETTTSVTKFPYRKMDAGKQCMDNEEDEIEIPRPPARNPETVENPPARNPDWRG